MHDNASEGDQPQPKSCIKRACSSRGHLSNFDQHSQTSSRNTYLHQERNCKGRYQAVSTEPNMFQAFDSLTSSSCQPAYQPLKFKPSNTFQGPVCNDLAYLTQPWRGVDNDRSLFSNSNS